MKKLTPKYKIKKIFYDCPICRSKSFLKIYGVSVFNVCVCRNCGVVCLNPRINEESRVEGFVEHYHAECFGDYLSEPVNIKEPYAIEENLGLNYIFNDLRKYLSSESRILDIGCRTGEILIKLKKNNFNNLTGIEPSLECCKRLQNFYNIECINKSFSEFVISVDKNKKFDCIILSHVLEQFAEPEKALKMINDLIDPEGILYIRNPDLYKWNNPFFKFSLQFSFYFTRKTLEMILRSSGFLIKEYLENKNSNTNEVVLIAQKQKTVSPIEYDQKEYKRVLTYLRKDKLIYVIAMAQRFIEESVLMIFGENVYLVIRNFFKKIIIKIIKIYKRLC